VSSAALQTWSNHANRALDQIAAAHVAVGGGAPGRRYATQEINHAYAVLLSSQFQRYCRDLHTESVAHVVDAMAPASLQPIVRARFLQGRKLDQGNPNPGNLGADFGRLVVRGRARAWTHRAPALQVIGRQSANRRWNSEGPQHSVRRTHRRDRRGPPAESDPTHSSPQVTQAMRTTSRYWLVTFIWLFSLLPASQVAGSQSYSKQTEQLLSELATQSIVDGCVPGDIAGARRALKSSKQAYLLDQMEIYRDGATLTLTMRINDPSWCGSDGSRTYTASTEIDAALPSCPAT
jgi:hypothetical protein